MIKNRLIIGVPLFIAFIAITIFTNAFASNYSFSDLGQEIGQQVADVQKVSDDKKIVATINGIDETEKGFNTYKTTMNQNGKKYSDKELLDKIIKKDVLYSKAIDEGLVATDKEIDACVDEAKKAIQQDENQYSFLKSYLKEMGLTEDEYWEGSKEVYKQSLSIGKLEDALRENYAEKDTENSNITDSKITKIYISDSEEFNTGFQEYYDNYVNSLIKEADIQTDIK